MSGIPIIYHSYQENTSNIVKVNTVLKILETTSSNFVDLTNSNGTSYQWQYQMGDYPLWSDIVGSTNNSYTTIQNDNQKYIRCVVSYGSNKINTRHVFVDEVSNKGSRMNIESVESNSLRVEIKGKTNNSIASNREQLKDGFRQNGKVKNTINFISI